MARIQRSNCRVFINGVDISDSVSDVQYSVEFEESDGDFAPDFMANYRRPARRTIRLDVALYPEDTLTLTHAEPVRAPQVRGPRPDIVEWDDVIAQANETWQDRDRVWHTFNAGDELGICTECGMWPEHHNHGSRAMCICQECKPDADQLPDDQHVVFNGDDRYRERR